MSTNALTATYSAPNANQVLSVSLPSLPADPEALDVQQKTAHLSALRSGVTAMQSNINALLTQKMEDDKAGEGGKESGKGKRDDARAEVLYGEEDADEDA
ncbi:hypothetical protein LTR08_001276 [Meristemomyces frigidus]|nr:hypothetical protein LTR08_001276 [Meristemomyces frigidus]